MRTKSFSEKLFRNCFVLVRAAIDCILHPPKICISVLPTGNERCVPKIMTNDTIKSFFLRLQSAFWYFQTISFSERCLLKLLPYILFEKCIDILALQMASPGNRHCANCVGARLFPIRADAWFRDQTSRNCCIYSLSQPSCMYVRVI